MTLRDSQSRSLRSPVTIAARRLACAGELTLAWLASHLIASLTSACCDRFARLHAAIASLASRAAIASLASPAARLLASLASPLLLTSLVASRTCGASPASLARLTCFARLASCLLLAVRSPCHLFWSPASPLLACTSSISAFWRAKSLRGRVGFTFFVNIEMLATGVDPDPRVL